MIQRLNYSKQNEYNHKINSYLLSVTFFIQLLIYKITAQDFHVLPKSYCSITESVNWSKHAFWGQETFKCILRLNQKVSCIFVSSFNHIEFIKVKLEFLCSNWTSLISKLPQIKKLKKFPNPKIWHFSLEKHM